MTFELGNIRSANEEWKAQKILLYGPQGLGKTVFGSTFEAPILVRTEDGACAIDVPTFPMLVSLFTDMEAAINALHGEHPYKTMVVDSLDWLEPIIWAKQVQERPLTDKGIEVTNIEDYGFGKGYAMVDEWWRYLMGGFDSLRLTKGMNIVLIAHSEIKTHSPPESDPYDRYQIKLHKRAAGLWQEWADMVLFANYKTIVKKTSTGFNKDVKRGTGSGERVIYTEERPAYRAKNRWGLPSEIYIGQDKTWAGFHQALSLATDGRYQLGFSLEEKAPGKKTV
ncbi:MAG: ATP-binding protein [Desulfobacteraceae bacterium]|nr:ATP-binding protein [Desulfobacteraceae bacterium]